MRAFALLRAIVEDDLFPVLTAPAQRALLVAVTRHADHNGWFEIKYATLAHELGCDERNAGIALRKAVPAFLHQIHQRRADGSRRACAFQLVERLTSQADEIVRLWVAKPTKSSSSAGTDENVGLPGTDEFVGAGTALERSFNGFGSDEPETNVPPADDLQRVRELVEATGFRWGGTSQ